MSAVETQPPLFAPSWVRRALYAIGAWTALGGVLPLVDPRGHCATFFAAPELADSAAGLLALRIGYAQLIAWGVGYALAGRHPAAWAPILIAGALGKTLYALITVLAFAGGSGTTALLLTGLLDLAIAIFFSYLVARGRRA